MVNLFSKSALFSESGKQGCIQAKIDSVCALDEKKQKKRRFKTVAL